MNKICLICFLSLVSIFVQSDIIGSTDDQVQKISDSVMDNLIKSLNENNYQNYIKDFDDNCLKEISDLQFKATKEKLNIRIGNIEHYEYLGFLTQNNQTQVLYKAKYSKINDEGLIKLNLNKKNNSIKITTFYFE